MKRLSIKMRMTLWYSALMLLLVIVVLGFMVFISSSVASDDAQRRLIRTVEGNTDEVEYDDGELEIDDDFVYLSNGVTSVVYTADMMLAGGYLPSGFATNAPLMDGQVQAIDSGGQRYVIYDRVVTSRHYDDLWIRGIVAADGGSGLIANVTTAAFLLLPFIVIVAALVGYQIARYSFRPIDKIARAANTISEGSDLTRRIGLAPGNDEIHRLAGTFDRMFERLEASFEEERQFTSDVSHELRTPTAVILSQCEFALAHAATVEEYREAVQTVERQASRMSQLISRLLNFTRLEQGVDKANLERTNVSELVEMICEEQQVDEQRGMTLSTDIAADVFADVDRYMMIRLLSNLIDNARQYGREGGHIKVSLQQTPDRITLAVTDDGIGIAPESLDRIWKRFYQVDPSRTSGRKGSMGLGLAMVSQIARLHGGYMEVSSEPDKGSCFSFILPINKK